MIKEPVSYTDEQLQIVNAYDGREQQEKDASFWSNDELKELRKHIKIHYVDQQSTRCCYCNRHQGSKHGRHWDIEHIACRTNYPHFMFEPLNLAASCPDCNIKKRTKDPYINKDALKNSALKNYPNSSNSFRILHPHFDAFEEHIKMDGFVYTAKTEKGKATIYACDLLRFSVDFIDWGLSASDYRFEENVNDLLSNKSSSAKKAINRLAKFLKTIKLT